MANQEQAHRQSGSAARERGATWEPAPVPPALLQAARTLRSHMTDAERMLWQCLRGKQLSGYRFRRQHPIAQYVLDFYCPAVRLAVEVDGGQHGTNAGRQRDAVRSEFLTDQGIRVLRFWNNQVCEDLEGVLERIWEALQEGVAVLPPPQPSPAGGGSNLLPPAGEVGRGVPRTHRLRRSQ